jgi:hypothetical protein
MTRTEAVAFIAAMALLAVFWAPIFAKYGVVAGLGWLAVTIGFLGLVIWAAGSSTKDPKP